MQKFINGVKQNRLYPETFEIPSDEEKANIQTGDYIKVGFIFNGENNESNAERMWLLVTEKTTKKVTGVLANNPIFIDCNYNDKFTINADEILSIIKKDQTIYA